MLAFFLFCGPLFTLLTHLDSRVLHRSKNLSPKTQKRSGNVPPGTKLDASIIWTLGPGPCRIKNMLDPNPTRRHRLYRFHSWLLLTSYCYSTSCQNKNFVYLCIHVTLVVFSPVLGHDTYPSSLPRKVIKHTGFLLFLSCWLKQYG